ncbi:MAG: FxsA family protein [Pseudomonadota bacterium]
MWLFLIFVVVPIIEIALFIQLGGALGLWPTLALVVLTALAGSILLRSQGQATLLRLRDSIEGRDKAADTLAHGALLILAGVVLVTPGFFTDAMGLSLLIPQVRAWLIRFFADQIIAKAHLVHTSTYAGRPGQPSASHDVIDGEFKRLDDEQH